MEILFLNSEAKEVLKISVKMVTLCCCMFAASRKSTFALHATQVVNVFRDDVNFLPRCVFFFVEILIRKKYISIWGALFWGEMSTDREFSNPGGINVLF